MGHKLYRIMQSDPHGQPVLGPTARSLGVRPGIDIPVTEGKVRPGVGGPSVSLDDALNLPKHRRPEEYGGTGRDPVFELDLDDLIGGLRLRVDPDEPTHGFLEPASEMQLADYRELIETTLASWRRV